MIYVHKILPLLASPLGFIFFLLLLFLVTNKRKWIWAAIFTLWFFSTPIVGNYLYQKLEADYQRISAAELSRADAVVVLSGMLTTVAGKAGPVTEWQDPDRFFGGIEVFKTGKADRLIFTRGQVPWQQASQPEGEYLRGVAIDLGISPRRILLTEIV